MTDKNIRITVNGDPIATVELTREAALSYLTPEQRRAVPDGWIPDPDKLTIAHLLAAQSRARVMGFWGNGMYRMNPNAVPDIESCLLASRVPDEYRDDPRWTAQPTAESNCIVFRGIPVLVTSAVPWVDFDGDSRPVAGKAGAPERSTLHRCTASA